MEMRRLGQFGPEISVVGYGAWEAGGEVWGDVPREHIMNAMEAAVDCGMNWFDTAEVYGQGQSERMVGSFLSGPRRDQVLVFTKVAPDGTGVRPDQIRKAIQGSLKRLRTDYVDLYQIHWPAHDVPVEDYWGAMAGLQDEGLTRFIGVSNFDRPLIERCLAIRHVDSVQNQFSLLVQRDRGEFLPWLEERGIGYLAYGPLAYGLLTGAITKDTKFADDDWRSGKKWGVGYYESLFVPGKFERNVELVERLRPIADRLGVQLAPLALRAAIEVKGVTGVIAGSRNQDHVRSNASAGDLKLDEKTREEIDEIFGP
ncbi:MAG TPA: aldo/keto reductase [Actinomycetota bacterium]|nr:aldo/keto reductase [Actinomycetota bacterium]